MESRWEGILASILNGFWWIFGGKLGGKMEPRSIPRGIEKAMEKCKAPSVLKASWRRLGGNLIKA